MMRHIHLLAFLLLISGLNVVWSQSYEELCQKASQLEEQDNLKASIAGYKKALGLKPDGRKALEGLAISYRDQLYKHPLNKKFQKNYLNTVAKLKDSLELEKALDFVINKDKKAHFAHFWKGELLLARGESDRAYVSYKKAYRLSPKNRDYKNKYLASLSSDKEILQNFSLLSKAYGQKKTPMDVKLKFLRGCVLKKRWTFAEKEFKKIYKKDKRLLYGSKDAINMFFYKKNYFLALNYSKVYLRQNPEDLEIRDLLIQCFQKEQKSPAFLHREISKYLKLDPQTDKFWLELAKLDLKLGKKDEALDHGKIWIKHHPKSREGYLFLLPLVKDNDNEQLYYRDVLAQLMNLDKKNGAKYQLALGVLEYGRGNFSEAKKWLSLNIRHFPNDKDLWYKLGVCQSKFNQDEESKQSFERAYNLDPECVECAKEFGKHLEDDSEVAENLALFEFLQKNYPDLNETLKYARALTLNGKSNEAATIWKRLAATDPQFLQRSPEAMVAMINAGFLAECLPHYPVFKSNFKVNHALAKKMQALGDNIKAIEYYVTAYKLDRDNMEIILNLSRLYSQTGEFSKSLDGFLRAIKIEPGNQAVQAEAVSVAEASQNRFYLKSLYEEILKLDLNSHFSFYGLGKIFLEEKKLDEALVYLSQAVNLAPDINMYQSLLEKAKATAGDYANVNN